MFLFFCYGALGLGIIFSVLLALVLADNAMFAK